MIAEVLVNVTLVAALVPKLTVAPERKSLPLIVTAVPPAVLPDWGLIEVTVGAVGVGTGLL